MGIIERKDLLLGRIRDHKHLSLKDGFLLTLTLSIPSMLAQASSVVMQYIDAAMVGALGAGASASVGLVSTTIWLFSGLATSLCTGFYVQVAHHIGGCRWGDARAVLRQSFPACLLLSVLLGAIGVAISGQLPVWLGAEEAIRRDATIYFLVFSLCMPFMQLNALCGGMLRASGNTQTPGRLNVWMCVLDVLFNFLLIFPTRSVQMGPFELLVPGAGLGVTGAVLGTALSFVVCSLAMFHALTRRSLELNLQQDSGSYLPSIPTIRRCLRISLPLGVEHFIMCSAQIMATIIVSPLGTLAIAANAFGITLESLCYMPGYGLGDAATTLVGQSLGAGRRRLACQLGFVSVGLGMAIMSVMGAVIYFASPWLMAFMTPDTMVQQLTVEVIRIEAFAEPMFAASIVAYGVFVGAGDTLLPCCMNLVSIWMVRIPLAAIMVGTMGLHGVWVAMAAELTFRGAIFLWRLWGKGWIGKKVTE